MIVITYKLDGGTKEYYNPQIESDRNGSPNFKNDSTYEAVNKHEIIVELTNKYKVMVAT